MNTILVRHKKKNKKRRSYRLFRTDGATIPTPNPPPGSKVSFHLNFPAAPYQVSFKKYVLIVFSGTCGVYSGDYCYKHFVLFPNPPNPQRLRDEVPPSRHPHAPSDDDDEDEDE